MAILGGIFQPHRLRLDGDAALAFDIHRIEQLRLHLARLDIPGPGFWELREHKRMKGVTQRRAAGFGQRRARLAMHRIATAHAPLPKTSASRLYESLSALLGIPPEQASLQAINPFQDVLGHVIP